MNLKNLQEERFNYSLSASRDKFTSMKLDHEIAEKIRAVIDNWQKYPLKSDPVVALRQIMEMMRKMPAGDSRNQCMNTFVRKLGEPNTLATWLDILYQTFHKENTEGKKICEILLSYKRHSHYGHYQILMLVSERHPTEGTMPILDKTRINRIKYAPQWDLMLSIWQPLAKNISFPSAKQHEPELLIEPPHTHPFNFVSKIVAGNMYQSVYRLATKYESYQDSGRYSKVDFICVDRTWPPHKYREEAWLKTLEHRVLLRAGDSYFFPSEAIHDVEMNIVTSLNMPTITLMLNSESTVLTRVFLEKSMLNFHDANPNLKSIDGAMPFQIWAKILKDTAAYLRGTSTLELPRMPIKDAFLVH